MKVTSGKTFRNALEDVISALEEHVFFFKVIKYEKENTRHLKRNKSTNIPKQIEEAIVKYGAYFFIGQQTISY